MVTPGGFTYSKGDDEMTFDVLGTLRAIRDDESLTTTQAHVLTCAVLRTDNGSCKVRMSIEGLAKDAKVSDKTARSVFKEANVLRYLAKVEGQTRSKNLWFHPIPVTSTGTEDATDDPVPVTDAGTPVIEGQIPVTDDRIPVVVTGHLPSTSTPTSTSESTKVATAADAPVANEDSPLQRKVGQSPSVSLPEARTAAPVTCPMAGIPSLHSRYHHGEPCPASA